jgi:hypothetical protein
MLVLSIRSILNSAGSVLLNFLCMRLFLPSR